MKNSILLLLCMLCLSSLSGCTQSQPQASANRIICNPLDLNYIFQAGQGESRREAADPVGIYFNDDYYIFASKSEGYWTSKDMVKWTYIPCKTIPIIMDYAPTVMAYKDALYFTVSSDGKPTRFFKNVTPQQDTWEEVPTKFLLPGQHDPAFFLDDDGRVYFYWGCSNVAPIVGVEVNPEDGFAPIGEPVTLISHQYQQYGWEVPGQWNDEDKKGWNEGPSMIKHNGRYYLQYAAPGTEYRTYADGYYVSDNPLGPFTYAPESPFSFKTGGFMGGAGHGDTFRDKYGNLWHIATMRLSVRHMFERRLGLFPVTITDDGVMYSHQAFSDYPFEIPDHKVDENHPWRMPNYNLLTRNAVATASSQLEGYEAAKGADEMVETWWSAQSGDVGEWLMLDLGSIQIVRALQTNFADQDFTLAQSQSPAAPYQYRIETSADGKKWETTVDKSTNTADSPHTLHVLDKPVEVRYLRITNCAPVGNDGKFSLYDLRAFGGQGAVDLPVDKVNVTRNSADPRRFTLSWEALPNVTGYIVHWGVDKNHLTHTSMVFENSFEAGHFNKDSEYYFEVTGF